MMMRAGCRNSTNEYGYSDRIKLMGFGDLVSKTNKEMLSKSGAAAVDGRQIFEGGECV